MAIRSPGGNTYREFIPPASVSSSWALVQQSASVAHSTTGTAAATLPGNSTAGTLLVAQLGASGTAGTWSLPSGWVLGPTAVNGATVNNEAQAYLLPANNPGGVSSFSFSFGTTTINAQVAEFSGGGTNPIPNASGSHTAGAVTTDTVSTTTAATAGDLAICGFQEHITAAVVTWTDPSGFSALDETTSSSGNQEYSAWQVVPSTGTLSVAGTTATTGLTNGWASTVMTFTPGSVAPALIPAPAPIRTKRTPPFFSRSKFSPAIVPPVVTVTIPVVPAQIRASNRLVPRKSRPAAFSAVISVSVPPPAPIQAKRPRLSSRAARGSISRGIGPQVSIGATFVQAERPRINPLRRGKFSPVIPPVVTVTIPPVPAPIRSRLRPATRKPGKITSGIIVTTTVTVPPTPAPIRSRRLIQPVKRGKIASGVVVTTTTVTIPPVPALIRSRRLIAPVKRGKITPGIFVTVAAAPIPVVPAPVKARLRPSTRKPGKISTGIIPVVTVTIPPVPAFVQAERVAPVLRRKRGAYRPAITVTVSAAPAPIVVAPVRAKRLQPARRTRGAFRRVITAAASAFFGPWQFAGTEVDTNLFGGSQTETNLYGGTVVTNQRGGSWVDVNANLGGSGVQPGFRPTSGGSATDANLFGGSWTDNNAFGVTIGDSTMQAVNITLGEFNDETINLAITNNGSAFNLTGFGLTALFKVSAGDLDSAGTTTSFTSAGGAITITNAAAGLATLVIPHASLQNTNFTFWRVDVTTGGTQATAIYGNVVITKL